MFLAKHIAFSALFVACLCATIAYAQKFGWFRGRPVVQNETSKSELIVALWRFGTNGNIGAMGRSHNYPESDQNLNAFLKWTTQLNMESKSNRVVELGSDEVFDHPFACISKPGGDVFDG